MSNIAIFPGSFDPITRGHENIILRALPLFEKIIVAVGQNAEKKGFFTIDQRIDFLKKVFRGHAAVEIDQYSGLTVEYCQQKGAKYILRGLRTSADFEFERTIGQVNKKLYPEIETIFLLTLPEYTAINSSVVREILKYGGDVSQFIPEGLSLSKDGIDWYWPPGNHCIFTRYVLLSRQPKKIRFSFLFISLTFAAVTQMGDTMSKKNHVDDKKIKKASLLTSGCFHFTNKK